MHALRLGEEAYHQKIPSMGDESIGPRYLDGQEQRLNAKDMRKSQQKVRDVNTLMCSEKQGFK